MSSEKVDRITQKRQFHEFLYTSLLADEHGFILLAKWLCTNAGVSLPMGDKNKSLMASRMSKLLYAHNCKNYKDFYKLLEQNNIKAKEDFLSKLTTHTTHFFREDEHFRYLMQIWPKIVANNKNSEIRVWCAASSTGEEVWCILMSIFEAAGGFLPPIKMLATDIDIKALQTAADAYYDLSDLSTAPPNYLQKYFRRVRETENIVRVSKELRNLVTFSKFNLLTDPYPFQHKFDIIFCRNVLIYFEPEEVSKTFKKMQLSLNSGGFLFLGHSEAVIEKNIALNRRVSAVYQLGDFK